MASRAEAWRLQGARRIGQALVYIYARETLQEAQHAKVLTFDEARRIAVNVDKLPKLSMAAKGLE